ncbi:MAG: O-antigen ligase family protein [Caldilineaceae bacterium]|jgi:O-antigen ligase
MKVRTWQNALYFPGISVVILWSITSYLDLAPVAARGLIQQIRLYLLLGWLSLQLFNHWSTILQALRTPWLSFASLPQFYWLIYAFVAFLSALSYSNGEGFWPAFYLVLWAMVIIFVSAAITNQPPALRLLYIKRLWQFTLFVLALRLLIFLVCFIVAFDHAVNPVNLGPITVFRIRSEGFYGALNANSVGYIGALLLMVAINRYVRTAPRQHFWLAVACLGIGALILGYSRTALVSLVMIGMIYLLLQRKFLWLVGVFLMVAILLTQFRVVPSYFMRGQTMTAFSSLNDRSYVWSSSWFAFLESPLTGYGYFAGERTALKATLEHYYPDEIHLESSHNTFLAVLLGTGLVGFVPFIATLLLLGWRILWHFKSAHYYDHLYNLLAYEFLALFLLLVFASLTLSSMIHIAIGIRNLPLLPLFVFAALPVARQVETISALDNSQPLLSGKGI